MSTIKKFYKIIILLSLICYSTIAVSKTNLIVEINGVKGKLRENIESFLSLNQAKDDPELTEEQIIFLKSQAHDEIAIALQPFGFYKPTIKSSFKKVSPNNFKAIFNINIGEPTYITAINIDISGAGAGDDNLANFYDILDIKLNQVLNHELYEKSKENLIATALDNGYLQAKYTKNMIEVEPEKATAKITLDLETGERYKFGEVNFTGSKINHRVLSRYPEFKPGGFYNKEKLNNLQKDLVSSNYFNLVEVASDVSDVDNNIVVPINVKLTDKKPNQYTFGIGYGTDTGPRGKLAYERRAVNKRGDKFLFDLKASQRDNHFEGRYVILGKRPASDRYVISIGRTQEELADRISTNHHGGATYIKKLSKHWQGQFQLNYENERYRAGGGINKENSTLLLPSANFIYNKKDDILSPTKGNLLAVKVLGAHEALLSSTTLVQADVTAKSLIPVFKNGKLILRGNIGVTIPNDEKEIPLSLRFFAGGDNSVRGFPYKSLGPTQLNSNNEPVVVGGRYLIVGSVEFEHKIYKEFSGAIFIDGGNALNNIDEALAAGAGIGVRWESPIGPIKFDLAQPLTNQSSGIRFHLRFGPEF